MDWEDTLNERATSQRRPLIEDRLGTRARIYGTEQAVLVGISGQKDADHVDHLLDELEALADTAGIPTLAVVVQNRERPDPATFVGKGKVDEIAATADEVQADVVVFNDELTPAQARNLEERLHLKVIDRTQLIMDIFAQRAATKEARLQVELAQLRYLLPRLRGWGAALTRIGGGTGGGVGTRGPGETQLELDRFKINRRIHGIERRLRHTQTERSLRRKQRLRSDVPQIALVGYTNSGKSTLLNRLCEADVLVEDKLFATLDTRARRGDVGDGREAVFIDTVGFIRALPHALVPAFAATLESAQLADVILHVVDLSSPTWEGDYAAVLDMLEADVFTEDAPRPPILHIWNKVDIASHVLPEVADGIRVSARTGEGVDDLLERVSELLYRHEMQVQLEVPFARIGDFHASPAARRAQVLRHTEAGTIVVAHVRQEELDQLVSRGIVTSVGDGVPAAES